VAGATIEVRSGLVLQGGSDGGKTRRHDQQARHSEEEDREEAIAA
jgi:hypothetical protein